jgi:hypothetical protein
VERKNLYIFNFKYFIKYVFKLILLVSIISLPLNYIFESQIIFKTNISGAYKVNKILLKETNNEIPIFGSSRALSNYVPSKIGSDVYNYGINGTGSKVWIFFLKNELQKSNNNSIIINFDINGFNNYLGDIRNFIPNYNSTKSLFEKKSIVYDIPVLKYYGFYFQYLKDYLQNHLNYTKITENGGSFLSSYNIPDKFNFNISNIKSPKDSFERIESQINEIMKLIQNTDRKIYFVISPYHKSYLDEFTNYNSYKKFTAQFKDFNNVFFIDLKNMDLDDSMFFNSTHLNFSGAKLFSDVLKDSLLINDFYE